MGRQATAVAILARRCRRSLVARRCTGRPQPLVRGRVDGGRFVVSRRRVGAHRRRACVLVASARQSIRSAARDRRLRLVPPRVEQSRSRLGARLHGRLVPVRRVPAARRTRRPRVSRRPPRLGSRGPRDCDRLCRGPARPRPPARTVLRPAVSGLQRVPSQPARGVGRPRPVGRPQPRRPLRRDPLGTRSYSSRGLETDASVELGTSGLRSRDHLPGAGRDLVCGLARPGSALGQHAGDAAVVRTGGCSRRPCHGSRLELGSESQGSFDCRAAHRRPRQSASTRRPQRRPCRDGRRSTPRPRISAEHD